MKYLVVLFLITVQCLVSNLGDSRRHLKFITLQGEHDFLKAQRNCRLQSGNWTLPTPNRPDQETLLASSMERDMVKSAWIGLRLYTLKNWIWTDGTILENWREFNKTLTCAALSREGALKRAPCKSKGVGFICEIPGEQYCPLQNCLPYKDIHLMFGCEARDWFAARSLCRKLGGDLAVFKSAAKVNFMVHALRSTWRCDHSHTSTFFIGLHQQDWLSQEDVNKVDKEGNLADKSHQTNLCGLVTYKKYGRLSRGSRRCINQAEVVCQSWVSLSSPPEYVEKEKNGCLQLEKRLRSDTTHVWLIAILVTVLITNVLVCVVVFRRKYTPGKRS